MTMICCNMVHFTNNIPRKELLQYSGCFAPVMLDYNSWIIRRQHLMQTLFYFTRTRLVVVPQYRPIKKRVFSFAALWAKFFRTVPLNISTQDPYTIKSPNRIKTTYYIYYMCFGTFKFIREFILIISLVGFIKGMLNIIIFLYVALRTSL